MKTRHVHLHALLLASLIASPAWAARDPFWPIGYEPPKPDPVVPQNTQTEPAVARPEQPPKPAVKPASEAEWAAARKALVISGFTQTVQPGTEETRDLAMVNRHMVAAGDTVVFVHQDIRFRWRVESITGQTIQFTPLTADRLVAAKAPPDLKQNP